MTQLRVTKLRGLASNPLPLVKMATSRSFIQRTPKRSPLYHSRATRTVIVSQSLVKPKLLKFLGKITKQRYRFLTCQTSLITRVVMLPLTAVMQLSMAITSRSTLQLTHQLCGLSTHQIPVIQSSVKMSVQIQTILVRLSQLIQTARH